MYISFLPLKKRNLLSNQSLFVGDNTHTCTLNQYLSGLLALFSLDCSTNIWISINVSTRMQLHFLINSLNCYFMSICMSLTQIVLKSLQSDPKQTQLIFCGFVVEPIEVNPFMPFSTCQQVSSKPWLVNWLPGYSDNSFQHAHVPPAVRRASSFILLASDLQAHRLPVLIQYGQNVNGLPRNC